MLRVLAACLLVLATSLAGCLDMYPYPMAAVTVWTEHDGTEDEWNRHLAAGLPLAKGILHVFVRPIAPFQDVGLPRGEGGCIDLNCSAVEGNPPWTAQTETIGDARGRMYPSDGQGVLELRMRLRTWLGVQVVGTPDPALTAGLAQPEDGCGWKVVGAVVGSPPSESRYSYPGRPNSGDVRIDGDRELVFAWHLEPMRRSVSHMTPAHGPTITTEHCW